MPIHAYVLLGGVRFEPGRVVGRGGVRSVAERVAGPEVLVVVIAVVVGVGGAEHGLRGLLYELVDEGDGRVEVGGRPMIAASSSR